MKLPQTWMHIFFVFILVITQGCKGKNSNSPAPAPLPAGESVSLTGTLTYDYVPIAASKLNYANTVQRPMRNVYVELINLANNSVLGTYNTNDSGQYSFSVTSGTSVKLRIYAEMKNPPVIIQDNTNSNAGYVLNSPNISVSANTVRNVNATSGWSGTDAAGSYSGTRMAAPFAMLDNIYTISKKITTARSAISFPLLKLNWSVDNISSSGDISLGQIGTSHYNSTTNQLYILGEADVDSDEFDKHIIVHEWGHFFENNLSRSDSPGGSHTSGDKKDISLAFGEAWGNALSAMAFDPDYYYTDTYGSRQQSGFQFNMESGTDTNKGWFSETSIQQMLYDIYDSTNEAGDGISQGIGPILDVLTGYQKTTSAATSIFSFITGLKTNVPSIATALDTLVESKNIVGITSSYGVGETNNGGWAPNLPVYNQITLGGAAVSLSLYGDFGKSDSFGLSNTIYNNKYLKFTAASGTTRLVVSTTDTFQINVYNKGTRVYQSTQVRSSASPIGPFTYDIPTTSGVEYRVKILTASNAVYDLNSLLNLTVTGSVR